MNSFYSIKELHELGLFSFGNNVLISRKASIYGASKIRIGDNVRIDDFCILSAGEDGIVFGNYIHLGAYSSIIGDGMVSLDDFVNISSRVSIYSSNDDYSGEFMTNPMVNCAFKNVKKNNVTIRKHSIIGSGSIILPGVTIGEGVAIGALSLVKDNCKEFSIYAGTPLKFIKERSRKLLMLEVTMNNFLKKQVL